jgi:hypothetical protein
MEMVQQIDSSKVNRTETRVMDHNWWSLCYILAIYQLPSNHTYTCHISYNKWPLGQTRLLTPYVTLYYTEYI